MLCGKCQQREARLHITRIIDGEMTTHYLCDVCGQVYDQPNHMQDAELIEQMVAEDPRYDADAYRFVQEGFAVALGQPSKDAQLHPMRHVCAAESLEAFPED